MIYWLELMVMGNILHQMLKNFRFCNYKSDLTIGSRLTNPEYSPNNLRLYSIKFLRILIKIFYKTEVTDCTSGYQILNKN